MKRRSASSMGATKTEGKKTPPAKMLCWFGLVCVVMAAPVSVTGSDSRTIRVTVPASSPLSLPIPPGGATALKPAAPSVKKDDDVGDAVLGSSRFQFRLSGAPGQRYSIEASPNLVNWTSVSTNQVSTAGFSDFTDTAPGEFPQRFYRTRPLAGGPIVLAGSNYRSDRILVKPLAGAELSVLHAVLGTRVLQTFSAIGNLQIIQVPSGTTVDAILPLFQQSGLVQYAERDYQVQALAVPNDFRYNDGSLWGLHNTGLYGGTPGADIHAQDGWDIQNTADNIIVAVIDTGVRYTHEDLADNMWVNPDEIPGNGIDDDGDGYVDDVHGINIVNNTGDPNDDHGHGTHVSGTVGGVGNNSVGVVGVAWKVQIMACKFLDASGSGFISDAVKCIDYARSKGAKVINASWGSTSFTSQALHDAIDNLRQAGIIFVAAAGNSAQDNGVNPIYPASYDLDNIISVAATTRNDDLAVFSNYGATTVDLGAPGDPIFSCWNGSDSDYRYFQGTSMAAPHVTGTCALLMAHYPNDNYQQIINRILSNVDPLPSLEGKCVSGGRLNLQKALSGNSPPPQMASVSVVATDADASEQGPDPGEFTFTRTGDTSFALTVNYTLGGTAQNGTDYQQPGTSVTIPAGAASATVTVTPIDDAEAEGDETVVLTLTADAAYDVGSPNSATITIHDNDQPSSERPTVVVAASDASASEQGPDPGEFTFTRTGDTSFALTVNYTLGGTAQNGTDYQPLGTSVTIPAGSGSATLAVMPIDDTEAEGDETVVLTLTADAAYDVGSPNSAAITIADNDQPSSQLPTVSVVATDADASEQGPDPGKFTFTRTGDTSSAVTVNYTLSGTATKWDDYRRPEGDMPESVTIPAGATSTTLTIVPFDDDQVEGDETVVLTISPDVAYNVGSPDSAAVTIHDNDSPPPPALTADFTANPTSGSVPLSVQFTDKSTGAITAWDWTFGDGLLHSSARNPGHIYLLPGDYTVTLKVTGSGGATSRKSLTIHATLPLPLPLSPGH